MIKPVFLFLVLLTGFPITSASAENNGGAQKPEMVTQMGHSGIIIASALSSDNRFILSGSYDKTVKLWNFSTGKLIRTFYGHIDVITCVAISKDNNYGLSGGYDGTVILWDLKSGEIKYRYTYKSPLKDFIFPTDVIFTPDSKSFITSYDSGEIISFDLHSFKSKCLFSSGFPVSSLDLSKDGRYLIIGKSNGQLIIWDMKANELYKQNFQGNPGGWGSDFVGSDFYKSKNAVKISPDNNYVLLISGGNKIQVWDINTEKEIVQLSPLGQDFYTADFSPNSRYIVSGGLDKYITIWDIKTGKAAKEITGVVGHEGKWGSLTAITSVCYTNDGKYVLASSDNRKMSLWDVETEKEIKVFSGFTSNVSYAKISADANYIFSCYGDFTQIGTGIYDTSIKIWDLKNNKLYKNLPNTGDAVSHLDFYSDNNSFIASTWGFRRTLKYNFNNEKNEYDNTDFGGQFALSADKKKIFTLTAEGASAYDLATNKELASIKIFKKSPDASSGVLSSAVDGKICAASNGEELLVFSTDNYKVLKYGIVNLGRISSLDISKDNKFLIIGNWEHIVKIWDIENWKELASYSFGERLKNVAWGYINVIFNDDRTFLVGLTDGSIHLCDMKTGNDIKTFYHNSQVTSLGPTGLKNYFISTSQDGTTRIWNMETGEWTAFIANQDGSQWLLFTNDGYWDGSPDCSDLVSMVRGLESWNIDQFAVKNNRPDIILKRLGSTDIKLIDHYYNQYLKRLRKLKLTEDKLRDDYHVPEAKIIEAKQNDKFMGVTFSLSDDKYKLASYNIYVNDVPLFGAYGKEISGNGRTLTEKIELTSGENKIEISCMIENGAESFRALTLADYDKPVEPDLYYIGFGVSDYKNNVPAEFETAEFERMVKSAGSESGAIIKSAYFKHDNKYIIRGDIGKNDYNTLIKIFDKLDEYPMINDLNFAHKDALDLAEVFKIRIDNFNNVYTYTFVNEQATVENIKKAKSLLKNAKPDDTFVLFIAGHGVHDTDKETTYYFLTYETDLMNLSGTAANFDLIEDMLQESLPETNCF